MGGDRFGFWKKQLTGRGQFHYSRISFKEGDAQFLLQSRDMTTERRLGDVEFQSGLCEVQGLGQGKNTLHLYHVHFDAFLSSLFFFKAIISTRDMQAHYCDICITVILRC
jgi:hypothetical protein